MRRFSSAMRLWLAGLVVGSISTVASAVVILDTGLTQPGFGWVGYDIFPEQSVGIAFQPAVDVTLDRVGLWFMSNDFDAPGRQYTLSLVTDAGVAPSIPNTSNVLESWSIATNGVGWTPVLDQVDSVVKPLLTAGTWYWLVAASNEPAGLDPLWVQAGNDVQYYSAIQNSANPGGVWFGGYSFGSTPGTVIEATPVPEPTMLGALAIAGIGSLRRRRA
ncbi:MAG: PEP-CTERM sorting domain-containing protein [Anaerolineae bacterium]|nr:PEP-CTERM sorting domain-containing protein [Phycisphaerae bacterium]